MQTSSHPAQYTFSREVMRLAEMKVYNRLISYYHRKTSSVNKEETINKICGIPYGICYFSSGIFTS